MKGFEFIIVASGLNREADDFESRFYDAGCSDATISFQRGLILLDFCREAHTLTEALNSAIKDVRSAGADVQSIEPDPLVSLSDIAERVGKTRAAVSLYATGQRGVGGFPPPVHRVSTSTPLYRWSSVARHFVERGEIDPETAEQALAIEEVSRRLDRERECA